MIENEGFLPVFNGFYGTVFEGILNEDYQKETGLIATEKEISKRVFNIIIDLLELDNFVKSAVFEKLYNPKQYNYNNDSINCIYYLDKQNLLNIYKYLRKNKKDFKEYLKENYTPFSGFYPYYSNKLNDWTSDKILKNNHQLSSIFNFILQNNGYTEISLYYDVLEQL